MLMSPREIIGEKDLLIGIDDSICGAVLDSIRC